MKLKLQSLILMMMAAAMLVSCDAEEVASELEAAQDEYVGQEADEDGEEGERDEDMEADLPEETLMALYDLQEEEITEFKLCVDGEGEVVVPLDEKVSFGSEEVNVNNEACEGSHAMVINGYLLEGAFSFETDEETVGRDVLDGLFELVEDEDEEDEWDEDCPEDEDHEFEDEDEYEDDEDEEEENEE